MPRIGEHDLRELELCLGQCLGRETSEIRGYVFAGVEAIGIGVLQSGDDCFGTRILNSVFEPKRGEIATFIERQDRRAFILARKETICLRGQKVTNRLSHQSVGGIESCQRIWWLSLFCCVTRVHGARRVRRNLRNPRGVSRRGYIGPGDSRDLCSSRRNRQGECRRYWSGRELFAVP